MTTTAIPLSPASVASARAAREPHGWACAGAPWAAWVSAKRTGCTPLLKSYREQFLQRPHCPRPFPTKNGNARARRAFPRVPSPVRKSGARLGVRHRATDKGRVRIVGMVWPGPSPQTPEGTDAGQPPGRDGPTHASPIPSPAGPFAPALFTNQIVHFINFPRNFSL